ncbi:MAG: serine hydrolase domain-containing protein [Pirellulales bacterium]
MKFYSFTLLLVCIAHVSPAFGQTLSRDASSITALVDSVGRKAVEKDGIVGISIGVSKEGETLYAQGFGLASVELNVPATDDTVYRIGSISKEFTAAAILLLVEDGKVALDDPITKYVSDYPALDPPVTILHLLQHTSGIRDFTRLPEFRKERPNEVTADEVIQRFQDLPVNFLPQEKHQYCNSGFFLLGVVIEKASGMTYAEFVSQRLLEPLKLDQTYCDSNSLIIPLRASGYSNWGGRLKNAAYININSTIGAGSMASTVHDLLRWQHALVGTKLLEAASSEKMMTRGELQNGKKFNYGLGVFVQQLNGQQVYRHGGGITGFRAEVVYYKESGYTIAVLSNCESANTSKYANSIARELLKMPVK